MMMMFQVGETALHKACKRCNYRVVEALVNLAKGRLGNLKDYINAVNLKVGRYAALVVPLPSPWQAVATATAATSITVGCTVTTPLS